MLGSDLDKFVGVPYSKDYDCCDLVTDVSEKLFGKTVTLPSSRPRGDDKLAAAKALAVSKDCLAVKIPASEAKDGDIVLMLEGSARIPVHAGLYFNIEFEGWVLHTSSALMRSSLHRISDLGRLGMRVEGYYRWKDASL